MSGVALEQAAEAVWARKLSDGDFRVLMALADKANPYTGRSFPTSRHLALELERSEATVQRAMRRLRRSQMIPCQPARGRHPAVWQFRTATQAAADWRRVDAGPPERGRETLRVTLDDAQAPPSEVARHLSDAQWPLSVDEKPGRNLTGSRETLRVTQVTRNEGPADVASGRCASPMSDAQNKKDLREPLTRGSHEAPARSAAAELEAGAGSGPPAPAFEGPGGRLVDAETGELVGPGPAGGEGGGSLGERLAALASALRAGVPAPEAVEAVEAGRMAPGVAGSSPIAAAAAELHAERAGRRTEPGRADVAAAGRERAAAAAGPAPAPADARTPPPALSGPPAPPAGPVIRPGRLTPHGGVGLLEAVPGATWGQVIDLAETGPLVLEDPDGCLPEAPEASGWNLRAHRDERSGELVSVAGWRTTIDHAPMVRVLCAPLRGPYEALRGAEAARAVSQYREAVGVAWAGTGGASWAAMIDAVHGRATGAEYSVIDMRAAGASWEPVSPLEWRRRKRVPDRYSWTASEPPPGAYAHTWDRVGAWLWAFEAVRWPIGTPDHLTPGFAYDAAYADSPEGRRPGWWLTGRVHGWPTELPNPLDQPSWYTTPLLRLAVELGATVTVSHAWTWPAHTPWLRKPAHHLAAARQRAQADPATLEAIKLTYSAGIANLAAEYHQTTDPPGTGLRQGPPFWKPNVAAQVPQILTAKTLRGIYKTGRQHNTWPATLSDTDQVTYRTDNPDPHDHAERIGLPVGTRIGNLRHKHTTPTSDGQP